MKYSLNIVKSMVSMCIFLGTPLLTYADCCNCNNTFVPAVGAWYDNGADTATLAVSDPLALVPFFKVEVDGNGITKVGDTTFVLSNAGVYLVHVGISVSNPSTETFLFGLQLDSDPIDGGIVEVKPFDNVNSDAQLFPLSTLSVEFTANAGDELTLAYLGSVAVAGVSAIVGPSLPTSEAFPVNPSNTAFITITQIK